MKRIMVIGVSAGVGKSTFAKRLGTALNIPVFHLDAYFWKPGWVQASLEDFSSAQRNIAERNSWIMEGNYTNTYEIRAEKADTIIYLELPRRVCLFRVFKRWLKNIGRTRPDLGEGCKEKLDWEFLKFIWTTYFPRKEKMNVRFQDFLAKGSNNEVITLKNKKEIKAYIEAIEQESIRVHQTKGVIEQ
ncbi:P-loop NTPase family protein [Falsibacillus albus]|uniref:Topology modulation protein n=1 Tax=Falsibacillus albus TaxID=2478915 RepID=A0A3L7JRC2_9BACI|nr:topology modulation protein [Falsibacillus albus]RLQ93378.1 topology modulation protein [Falsibacillus albus]